MPNLSPRLMLQVEAGLKNDCDCADTIRSLFERGRQLGLSSAEMDAALNGSSFEVRASAAVTFACAVKSGDPIALAAAKAAGARVGLSVAELASIEDFTRARTTEKRS